MNRRMILFTVGQVCEIIGALMVLPLIVSLIYREEEYLAFVVTIALSVGLGLVLTMVSRPRSKEIFAKDGFVIVASSWVVVSLIGALPFVISGEIPNYIDAVFETVSGFTTTGASILVNVEEMSRGMLFWRSFTHWIGGMGVLVFIMAVIPAQNNRNMYILRAESPGPIVGKLVPRLRDTARTLYFIYSIMSLVMVLMELLGGMPLYEALVHMFGTAGTGGFGVKADSIAGYNAYLQWVITIFMILFGVNFNVYYLVLRHQRRAALHSQELHVYLGIWLGSVALVTINILPQVKNFGLSLRQAAFQTASIMTTTGFATTDFNQWPVFSKTILVLLMCVGACAGSTGGGFKVSRLVMLMSNIKREVRHLTHPRSVEVVKFEGKRVDDHTLHGVTVYFAICAVILAVSILLLSLDKYDMVTNITASTACFNNIGPGLGVVGPAGNYSGYSWFSKIVLSADMLLGRLEVYPLIVTFTPSTWSRKS